MEILVMLLTLGFSGIVIVIYLVQRLEKKAELIAQTPEGSEELAEIVENSTPKQVDFGVGTGFKFGFGFGIGIWLAFLLLGTISFLIFSTLVQNYIENSVKEKTGMNSYDRAMDYRRSFNNR